MREFIKMKLKELKNALVTQVASNRISLGDNHIHEVKDKLEININKSKRQERQRRKKMQVT